MFLVLRYSKYKCEYNMVCGKAIAASVAVVKAAETAHGKCTEKY